MPPPPAHPPSQSAPRDISPWNAAPPRVTVSTAGASAEQVLRSGREQAPDPSNTRLLLASLEDLRDSLSTRVEQLSIAVERLRSQASELESAVASGSSLAPGFGRPGGDREIQPIALPLFTSRFAPRVTRTTTTTVTNAEESHDPIEAIARSLNTMTVAEPNYTARILQADYRGLAPTNLAAIASQPKPCIVRSPAASVEPEAEEGSSTAEEEAAPTPADDHSPPEPSPADQSPAEPAEPSHTPADPNDNNPSSRRATAPPVSRSEWEWFMHARIPSPTAATTDRTRRPPGLTTRGMLVQARQGVPLNLDDSRNRHDRDAREAERLDRAIARYQRRHDESEREFNTAWDHERMRAIHGGRIPNEFSTARAEALRRHVDNSHRLWHLIHQRGRLNVGSAGERSERGADAGEMTARDTAAREAMRSLMADRRTGGPLRARRPRIIPAAAGVPASPPPRATPLEVAGMERSWIERIENERSGTISRPTPDQFEYEYYRDFLFEDRQRLRRQRADVAATTVTAPTDDVAVEVASEDTEGGWPQRRLELLERLAALRAQARDVSQRARTHRANFEAAMRNEPGPPNRALDRLAPPPASIDSPPFPGFGRDTLPLPSSADEEGRWRPDRAQLLDFLEHSRATLNNVADEADRIHPLASSEDRPRQLPPSRLRAHLERLATDERTGLIAEPGSFENPIVLTDMPDDFDSDTGPFPLADDGDGDDTEERDRDSGRDRDGNRDGDGDDDVLERVERARERVRALSRLSRDLAAMRAGMGLLDTGADRERTERTDRETGRSRRASDAETVVPSDWARTRPEDFAVHITHPHSPPPVPPPPRGLADSSTAQGSDAGSSSASMVPASAASAAGEAIDSAASDSDSLSASAFLSTPSSARASSSPRPLPNPHPRPTSGEGAHEEEGGEEDKPESGALRAENWPAAPAQRRPRPYVSLLDL